MLIGKNQTNPPPQQQKNTQTNSLQTRTSLFLPNIGLSDLRLFASNRFIASSWDDSLNYL